MLIRRLTGFTVLLSAVSCAQGYEGITYVGFSAAGLKYPDTRPSFDAQFVADRDFRNRTFIEGPTSSTMSAPSSGYAVTFGSRFLPFLAAEFTVIERGPVRYHSTATVQFFRSPPRLVAYSIEQHGDFTMMLRALGMLPLSERVDLFASAGIVFAGGSAREKTRYTVDGVEWRDSSWSPIGGGDAQLSFGLGASFTFSERWVGRLHVARMPKALRAYEDKHTVDMVSLDLLFAVGTALGGH